MKIAVVIPTRERPKLLSAMLTAFDKTSSGRHEISYVVRCDNDVPETERALIDLRMDNLTILNLPPPVTVGQKVNEAVAAVNADIYVQLCDDVFPLKQHWDQLIVSSSMRRDVFYWHDQIVLGGISYPVMTKKWLKALDWKMWPELFPYWYADIWIEEVYEMATGQRVDIIDDLKIGGERGDTLSGREFKFWLDFYIFTRSIRIEDAKKVQKVLGLPERIDPLFLHRYAERDNQLMENTVECERIVLDKRTPSASYTTCKRNAEQMMARAA